MKNKQKFTAILLSAMLLLAAGGYWYVFMRTHRTAAGAKPDFTLTAATLLADFQADEAAANQKYLGKIVAVTGQVVKLVPQAEGDLVIILASDDPIFGISARIPKGQLPAQIPAEGTQIQLQGIVDGYLDDVILSQAAIVSP